MKSLVLVLMLFLNSHGSIDNDPVKDMDYIRGNYAKAVLDKKLCKMMLEQLDSGSKTSVHLAYLGAFKTIWASHAINPISKLNAFNTGKKYIEAAIKESPDDIEIRFIRLTVQKNCPAFLGYNSQVEQDLKFIHANKKNITSVQLKKMIAEVIKNERS